MSSNHVYIGTSLDGFLADQHGGIEFLDVFPFDETDDMGYQAFIDRIDALVMGRKTFEKVLSFGIDWPYTKPVYVSSNTIQSLPPELENKVIIVKGGVQRILKLIHQNNHLHLYIDGAKTIQSFLFENLIDEMIITTVPVLIGNGISLFGDLPSNLLFKCVESTCFRNGLTQSRFLKVKKSSSADADEL